MSDTSITTIADELDKRHAEAQQAFNSHDIARYRYIFSTDLKYTQHDGRTIDLDQLMSDVQKQFSRCSSVGSQYKRESLVVHATDHVTETLTQTAWAEVRVMIFFKRRWNVHRRGQYSWKNTRDGWQITNVLVLDETVS